MSSYAAAVGAELPSCGCIVTVKFPYSCPERECNATSGLHFLGGGGGGGGWERFDATAMTST
jgi:hypothetical protein